MKKAIVLLSGGLDSSTTLAIARDLGFTPSALTISYGQRNAIEINSAKNIASHFKIFDHKIVELDMRIFGCSSLTDNIDVLAHDQQSESSIPNTYVPARNTIMLSIALAHAEVSGASDIFYGANVYDYSGYPDCRPAYIEAFEKMANLATKHAVLGNQVRIHAPLVNMTKSEIITKGVALEVPYELTLSCYSPIQFFACGQCSACFYRQKGFIEAGVKDPTRYVSSAISEPDLHQNCC